MWLTGAALIFLYAVLHGYSLYARDAGILAMDRARASRSPERLGQQPVAHDLTAAAPDTQTWSPKRVSAYLATLTDSETPAALLRIPSLKLTVPVFDGATEWNLNRGAGRIAGTATLASAGNLGIAAHRDGFFRPLRHISVGDLIYLDTATATIRYQVTNTSIVTPDDIGVLAQTPTRTVTLVTCYPFYYIGPAPQRFIVHAIETGR